MASVAMRVEARGVSAGRVFERAFATIRHNPAVTLGLALLVGAVPGAISTYVVSLARVDATARATSTSMWGLSGLFLLSFIFGVVINALVQGVLTRATVAESEGRKASFGECLRAGLSVLLPLVGLSLILAIGIGIGLVLLIVPGVMLYIAWCVAAPALVEERRGVFGSFGRSNELTKGSRWKIFGILLVLLVAYYLISAVIGLFGLANINSARDLSLLTPGFLVGSVIMGTVINVFWGTVQASLFVELRDSKDGPAAQNLEEVFS